MKTRQILLIGCGVPVVLFAIGVIALMIWLFTGPEGGVRLANDMEPYAVKYLDEHQILEPDEQLIAYYDVTISLNGREAAILTTERVIYHSNGVNAAINLEDIVDVRHRTEPFIGDVIEIAPADGLPMVIEIAPFNHGETFKNVLFDAWVKALPEAP